MREMKSSRRLSLGSPTLPHATPIELIEAAAGADIRTVGIRLAQPAGDAKPQVVGNEPLLREIGAALRHHGVALHEMGAVVLNGPRPSSWCIPALEAGTRLGAQYVIAFVTEPDASKRLDDFSDLCDAAKEQGMGVAIEFVVYSTVRTVEEAVRMVRQSGRTNASIVVDVLHLNRSGGSAASLAAVTPDLISIAQLCDAPLKAPVTLADLQHEARCDRLDPGKGGLALHDFVAAVPAHIPLELEVPNLASTGMLAPQRIRELAERTRRFLDDH